MSRRSEDGQTGLLIIGFFLVAVLLVVVVVDASAAYLRRQELDALADGAALAAADAIREEQVYTAGLDDVAPDPVAAREQVAEYLRAVGAHGRYPGLRYTMHTGADSVSVQVTTPLELPFAPPGWANRTDVTGRAEALVAVDP